MAEDKMIENMVESEKLKKMGRAVLLLVKLFMVFVYIASICLVIYLYMKGLDPFSKIGPIQNWSYWNLSFIPVAILILFLVKYSSGDGEDGDYLSMFLTGAGMITKCVLVVTLPVGVGYGVKIGLITLLYYIGFMFVFMLISISIFVAWSLSVLLLEWIDRL